MAGMITRCPKCATAFRISDTHLKSAKGMVRCGNCLEVFNASLHLQRRTEAPPSSSAKVPPVQPQQSTQALPKAEPEAPKPAPDAKPQTGPASASHNPSAPTHATSDDAEEIFEEDDEAWALELLKDDTDLNIKLKKIVSTDQQSKLSGADEARATPPKPTDFDNAPTEPAIDERASSTDNPVTDPLAEEDPLTDEALAKGFVPPKPLHEMLSAIEDPLEVAYEDPAARWRRRLLWGSLSLLAGLALLAQVAWLEFYRLAKVEPYRRLYGEVCAVLGCTLPVQADRAAIATSNLIIRSHPERKDALVVDVIIENRAAFEQTFPGIVLTFTDLRNQPVATRRFAPREYLGGELAGSTHMPVDQPIHIGFEIHDPGSHAQSYRIAIVD